ncbi:unknown [Segatella copri CAG:164]|nr:unknown [Segatella copri CAG:164]
MYNHINLKTDKLIYLKTYIIINENAKLHLNKYTNCQQL